MLRLPVHPHAPMVARTHLRQVGGDLPADVLEDATLAVSELVSNAVRYAAGDIRLVVSVLPEAVRIEVHDDGEALVRSPPAGGGLPPVDESAEHGRGLIIVSALATRWGATDAVPPPGKKVWLEIRLPTDPEPGQH